MPIEPVATLPADYPSPQADQSAKPGESMRPSELAQAEQLRVFKAWFAGDERHSRQWRDEAKADFDFVCPDGQWSEDDKRVLRDQNRTPIEFNRILTVIRSIAGMEINGRHEIAFLPRTLDDAAVNETLTGASKWMSDECDGEDEESEAFEKAVVCGMGWTEHRMDYLEDRKGKYIEESTDPLEMFWDRTARKKNLVDARRIWHVRVMPLSDAQSMFPGFDRNQLDAKWARGNAPEYPQKTLEEKRVRDENSSGPLADQDEVTLVRLQWWEREPCWCVADPANNKMLEVSDDVYEKLQKRHAEVQSLLMQANPMHRPQALQAVKGVRKVFKQAFIGAEVLECTDGPLPDRFSFTCITGQLHHNKRKWFGLVRMLRDPQMWANKLYSQVLHILNSTAKGGILAETDAFEDQRQAEATLARPDAITWTKKGAIKDGKIMPKPGQGEASAYVELLAMAINATRDVSGINLELLGQKDINQPGILEAMRKQAGMTVLATMFDALRRMRKLTGRIRLYFIQNFLSDGRLIRVVGKDGAKTIPLLRDKTLGEYDVVVDDTPTSPNQKQANWAIIASLLPAFKDQLMARPEIFLKILDYSPLPVQMVEAIKEMIQQQPPPDPMTEQLKQATLAGAVAKASKDQAQAELFLKQASSTEATAMYDMAMAQNLLLKHNGDMVKAAQEWQKQRQAADQAPLDAAHKVAQIGTEQAKADQIRAQTDKTHADRVRAHVGSLIDALSPIPHHQDAFPAPMAPAQ